MPEVKISVIIPVYNCEEYLEECLKSVAQQTLKDLQVVLIDDGSSDGSSEICKQFVERYPFFEYHYQTNKGPGAARNLGLDYAKGEYIGFIDSDDWIDSNMYDLMFNTAKQNDNADIVFVRVHENENIRDKGYISLREGYYNKKQIETEIYPFLLPVIKENGYFSVLRWSNCLRIYKRKKVIDNYIRFIETSSRAEDLTFSFHCTICADSYFCLDKELYHNRSRKGSISTKAIDRLWEKYRSVLVFLSEAAKKSDYDFQNQLRIAGYYFCEKAIINETHQNNLKIKKLRIEEIVNDELCQESAKAVSETNLHKRGKELANLVLEKDTKSIIRYYMKNRFRDKVYNPLYGRYLSLVKRNH